MMNKLYLVLFISLLFSNLTDAQNLITTLTPDAAAEGHFGNSTSSAGDVNNDGYDDLIIGAPATNNNLGAAYLYFGGESINQEADLIFTGDGDYNEFFGASAAKAGDINNDGFDDIIIGGYGYDYEMGRAYIYFGGPELDETPDLIIESPEWGMFGSRVSSAGDVNADGYDDFLVGAKVTNAGTGKAYLYFGGAEVDLLADIIMIGEYFNNYFGTVSPAGDVNNDGYDDIIVGGSGYSVAQPPTHDFTGRAYVYFGGAEMDNVADVVLQGEDTGNYFGISVSCAGDVNADGFSDIIIGADGYNDLMGRAYIYYGGEAMDSIADVTMTGEAAPSGFGNSVSGAGDINNDSYADVIVGAFALDGYIGKAYVYYGSEMMDDIADETILGEAPGDGFGGSLSVAGDVNNDGYDDYMVGARGVAEFTGKVYVYTSINVSVENMLEIGNDITVYPNPASERLTINSDSGIEMIKIFSQVGQLVEQQINTDSNIVNLNVADFESGIYFVKVFSHDNVRTRKLVIE